MSLIIIVATIIIAITIKIHDDMEHSGTSMRPEDAPLHLLPSEARREGQLISSTVHAFTHGFPNPSGKLAGTEAGHPAPACRG